MDLDEMSSLEIVTVMNNEDKRVPYVIEPLLKDIAVCVDHIVEGFNKGGRLVYLGAGTSGRLGVLDASECPPTFGVDKDMVIGIIAGGDQALRNNAEGAEDCVEAGKDDLMKIHFNVNDVLVGIAASGRTPYVKGAIQYAHSLGAYTIAMANNKNSEIGKVADMALEAETGPEVLTGSTRLKAGTAQKLILNMLTTASMVRMGKAYENLMVDVKPANEKLYRRAENIVMEVTSVNRETARRMINEADGNVKVAIVMLLTGKSKEEAKDCLSMAKGHIRGI